MTTGCIEIHGLSERYRPGETVSGSIVWNADRAPGTLEIRLFWITSGVSPPQVGLIETRPVDRPTPSGSSRFAFALPEGPWSFAGVLARLDWVVEAVMRGPPGNARVMFSVGFEGWQPDLYAKEEGLEAAS